MLASAHSVSENGAPAAGFFRFAEGAIDYSLFDHSWAEVSSF
jgi:hypothetical protein